MTRKKGVGKMQTKNVRITQNGAVHKKVFSWLTACGKTFGEGGVPVLHDYAEDTHDVVTCATCKKANAHDYTLEYGYFGATVTCLYRVPENIDFILSLYSIEIVIPPFVNDAGGRFTIRLPSDEHAISMAQAIVSWYMHAKRGELFMLAAQEATGGAGQ